jgi:hypothetical protein
MLLTWGCSPAYRQAGQLADESLLESLKELRRSVSLLFLLTHLYSGL